MKVSDFLQLYCPDQRVQAVGKRLYAAPANDARPAPRLQLAAALHTRYPAQPQLFALPDREEATYFLADLRHLLPHAEPLLLPSSYRRPYELAATEKAHVLRRADTQTSTLSAWTTGPRARRS